MLLGKLFPSVDGVFAVGMLSQKFGEPVWIKHVDDRAAFRYSFLLADCEVQSDK
jgi:hypothetical protein